MINSMSYKDYTARIEYDDEDGVFVGHIAGINDVVGFHADTVAELRAAFEEAVDDYIETCAKAGKAPQKPYSGRVMFRIAPEVHRHAALAAEMAGTSLNQWAEEVLARAAGPIVRGGRQAVGMPESRWRVPMAGKAEEIGPVMEAERAPQEPDATEAKATDRPGMTRKRGRQVRLQP